MGRNINQEVRGRVRQFLSFGESAGNCGRIRSRNLGRRKLVARLSRVKYDDSHSPFDIFFHHFERYISISDRDDIKSDTFES